MTPEEDMRIKVVDGRDALLLVLVTPDPDRPAGGVVIEAAANGVPHDVAARILREVAQKWDPQ